MAAAVDHDAKLSAIKKAENKTSYGHGMNSTLQLPANVDYSDPELKTIFKKVSDIKNPLNWCLFQFKEQGKSDKLEVAASGDGGFPELHDALSSAPEKVFFGALLIIGTTAKDRDAGIEMKKAKVIYITYCGEAVPKRAAGLFNPLKRKAQGFFGGIQLHLDVQGENLDQLTPNSLGFRLMHSEGSHKSSHFDFGGKMGLLPTAAFTNGEEDPFEDDSDFD